VDLFNRLLSKTAILAAMVFLLGNQMNVGFGQGNRGNFYISPDFGLMLGNINQIEISPAAGYCITDRISIAAGIKYEYYSQTRLYSNQTQVKTNIYGTRIYSRYVLLNNISEYIPIGTNSSLFIHAELESSSLERKYFYSPNFPNDGRFWYSAFLVGGGIAQPASERLTFYATFLWDTRGGSISIYNNPVIRFGMLFYLRPLLSETV
jgi:hypothetical protein